MVSIGWADHVDQNFTLELMYTSVLFYCQRALQILHRKLCNSSYRLNDSIIYSSPDTFCPNRDDHIIITKYLQLLKVFSRVFDEGRCQLQIYWRPSVNLSKKDNQRIIYLNKNYVPVASKIIRRIIRERGARSWIPSANLRILVIILLAALTKFLFR